ncbi:hypothetical protein FsymDg_2990 [Candidatus Protofrankia datiscae]|uniref:Uncharacterized protein n=1 Tax=Candidatus Protofrankia datiscae TaxID=2716812 RepID=F8AWT2_9ACTN|nr:hypothetical protein FsymDg_2990 [Candidatus Protofrankia datiscae]
MLLAPVLALSPMSFRPLWGASAGTGARDGAA